MSCIRLLVAALLLLSLAAVPGRAGDADQANVDILRDSIRANRKAMVAANLKLTDQEATAFWPIYERYQTELKTIDDRMVKLIEDYGANFGSMTDEKATQLADQYLTIDADRVKLKRTYLEEFGKAIPAKKVVRVLQIENKMDAVTRYALAENIPVIEQ